MDVDTLSGEYENGSALHISATNLGLEAAKVLLTYGADPQVGWSNHYKGRGIKSGLLRLNHNANT